MTEPTDGHSHGGVEVVLFLTICITYLVGFGAFMGQQHQFDVIYDRVGEIQRQLECPPGELVVTDQNGVEYCLDPAEESE